MMQEFEKQGSLKEDEVQVKQWFLSQYKKLKEQREREVETQSFVNKDYKSIQIDILRLNQKLKDDLWDVEDDQRGISFSGVTNQLSEVLRKLGKVDQQELANQFKTTDKSIIVQDQGKYNGMVEDIFCKVLGIQLQTAKKALQRYKHGRKKTHMGVQTEYDEELMKMFVTKEVVILREENGQLKIQLDEEVVVNKTLTKENQELNLKHTKINEKFRELTNDHKDLQVKHNVQVNENQSLTKTQGHIENKYGEMQNSYRDLMTNLENAIQRASQFKKDRKHLIKELVNISQTVREVKASKIFQQIGITDMDSEGEENKGGDQQNLINHQFNLDKLNKYNSKDGSLGFNTDDLNSSKEQDEISQKQQADNFSDDSSESGLQREIIDEEGMKRRWSKIEKRYLPVSQPIQQIDQKQQIKEVDRIIYRPTKDHLRVERELEARVKLIEEERRKEKESQDKIQSQLRKELEQLQKDIESKEQKQANLSSYDSKLRKLNDNRKEKKTHLLEAQLQNLKDKQKNEAASQNRTEKDDSQKKQIKIYERKVPKESKGIQVPDEHFMKQQETLRMINKKEFCNKLLQTEDLVDEELLNQLKEQKQKYGLKIFATRNKDSGFSNFSSSGIQIKSSAFVNQIPPEFHLDSQRQIGQIDQSTSQSPGRQDNQSQIMYEHKVFIPNLQMSNLKQTNNYKNVSTIKEPKIRDIFPLQKSQRHQQHQHSDINNNSSINLNSNINQSNISI
eukprot:403360866